MLHTLYLKNFTVIQELTLHLHTGLSVLSGETGAGKSIIVDAVSLCLGARADIAVIRHRAPHCEITLCFDIQHIPTAQQWLSEHGWDTEDNHHECIISRILQRDGRSRSLLNGKPCALSAIRELGRHLIVIHGQHHSQTLLQRTEQQRYIDLYGKHQTLLEDIRRIYQEWQTHDQKKSQLQALSQEREQQLDFLRYQMEEFKQLDWKENEWPAIHDEHHRLHKRKEDKALMEKALYLTIESEEKVQKTIKQITAIAPHHSMLELIYDAAEQLQIVREGLQSSLPLIEISEKRLTEISERLTQLHDMARKHRTTIEGLPEVMQKLAEKISQLENSDTQIQALEQKQTLLLEAYQQKAMQLTDSRSRVAKKIEQSMTEALQILGMKGGVFTVMMEAISVPISPEGNETLHFYIQTNPGQTSQPLAKIVSGGELSRISLALQTLIHQLDPVPTLIFDEVDTGIGGHTAEMVGKLLHDLAQSTQVYCITHLPQIAAQGDHHYRVSKISTTDSTHTEITELTHAERINELARMISGSKVTKETLAHAAALLQ